MSHTIGKQSEWSMPFDYQTRNVRTKLVDAARCLEDLPKGIEVDNKCGDECIVRMDVVNGFIKITITPNPDHFQL